jgi:hypothetical protein
LRTAAITFAIEAGGGYVVKAAGFPEGRLVWQMLWSDLIGNNYLLAICGSFPLNQRRFVESCIEAGFDRACYGRLDLIEAEQ